MTDKVFLIWASQGEYSDRSEWPVHAYVDKVSAEWAVVRLSALYRELKRRHDQWKEEEAEEAYMADGYDWEWAEKKAFRTKEGRQFIALYGSKCDLSSGYDLNLTCLEIAVRPPNLAGVLEQSIAA